MFLGNIELIFPAREKVLNNFKKKIFETKNLQLQPGSELETDSKLETESELKTEPKCRIFF